MNEHNEVIAIFISKRTQYVSLKSAKCEQFFFKLVIITLFSRCEVCKVKHVCKMHIKNLTSCNFKNIGHSDLIFGKPYQVH